MTDRPILMSAPMVRALLAGCKSQTRRIAPIERFDITDHDGGDITWALRFTKPVGHRRALASYSGGHFTRDEAARIVASQFCPLGKPGDLLWVRESWMDLRMTGIEHRGDDGQLHCYAYRADTMPGSWGDECRKGYGLKWRPSIHMPRWASRLTLEITGVRVQRLQDISEDDAWAEGAPLGEATDGSRCYALGFIDLWESIHGPGSWDANPWVWALEFRVHRANIDGVAP